MGPSYFMISLHIYRPNPVPLELLPSSLNVLYGCYNLSILSLLIPIPVSITLKKIRFELEISFT